MATHEQFEGRAHQVFSADRFWAPYDHNGHGTHVAGTIAGRTFGVAKKATVFSVKVLHVGSVSFFCAWVASFCREEALTGTAEY